MPDKLNIGFGKVDITPRIGVELAGFGPFLNRRSIAVRDRLWARVMAISIGGKTLILASCDLVGINPVITEKTREIVKAKTGLESSCVMICCTHTHSGPSTGTYFAWGADDKPYIELLPYRIARACEAAVADMSDAIIGYAEAPCEGIGLNRVYDKDAPPLGEVLSDDWRPAKPELTDTICRVITANSGGKLKGFISSFGCHPVTCCDQTRYIHGDYAGVATNNLEREFPGSVGLFLQGASGDVNSCVVHKPEQASLLALDIIAGRFANCVREAIKNSKPVEIDSIDCISRKVLFSRRGVSIDYLRQELARHEEILEKEHVSDADQELRNAVLFICALRKLLDKLSSGEEHELNPQGELQLLGIGPITFFGAPFEVFQAIKNDIVQAAESKIPVVVSHANASLGYAPSNDRIGSGDYADSKVPIIKHSLPFANIHNELVSNFLDMEKCLSRGQNPLV